CRRPPCGRGGPHQDAGRSPERGGHLGAPGAGLRARNRRQAGGRRRARPGSIRRRRRQRSGGRRPTGATAGRAVHHPESAGWRGRAAAAPARRAGRRHAHHAHRRGRRSKPPRARRRRARRRSGASPEGSTRRGDDLGPAGDSTDGGGGGRFAVRRSGDRARRRPGRPAGREPPADRGARHGARPGGRSARVGRGPLPRRPLRRRRRRRSGPLRGRRAGPRPPSPARHLAGRANGDAGARARTAGGRVAGARYRRRRSDRDREMTDLLRSRRALIWFLALGLAASGALLVTRMPSGIYPEMDFPRIVVVARSGEAPAELTQATLGRPLEVALATVQGIERVRSRAIRGAVEISLLFAPGTDMWRALQLTESRVGETRSALPAGADVVVERLTTTSFPVITFNVTGPVDSRRLRDLGELVLRPAISRVRGVGRVEVLGGDVREIEIILDPARTAALKLSPTRIAEKVRDASVLQAVGRFDDAHALVTVMASGEPHEASDL